MYISFTETTLTGNDKVELLKKRTPFLNIGHLSPTKVQVSSPS